MNFPIALLSPNAPSIPNRSRKINSFDMLMKQQQVRTAIAHKPETNNKHKLFNDLADLCNLQFPKDLFASGRELLDCVVEELWAIDGN